MPRAVGVIDASCVIALDALNLLPPLALLFAQVLIPKAVRTELYRRRATKDRVRALLNQFAFVRMCDEYDQGAVDVLLVERSRLGKKDRGETEAVVQAAAVGAMVIVDDRWGRRLAEQYSLDYHGVLWILERLHALGVLNPQTVRQHLCRLRQLRIRLPLHAANEWLRLLGEAPLA